MRARDGFPFVKQCLAFAEAVNQDIHRAEAPAVRSARALPSGHTGHRSVAPSTLDFPLPERADLRKTRLQRVGYAGGIVHAQGELHHHRQFARLRRLDAQHVGHVFDPVKTALKLAP